MNLITYSDGKNTLLDIAEKCNLPVWDLYAPLNKLEKGVKGKVMGVTLDNKTFLDYLNKLNICIGTEIELLETISFDQSLSIKIKNTEQHISNDVAKHLLIKIEN